MYYLRFVSSAVLGLAVPLGSTADAPVVGDSGSEEVVVIKSPPEILSRQKLPYFVGISAQTVGARRLSMNLVIIPPGGRAEPHVHKGFESAVYVLKGRVETRFGPNLESSVISEAGDFLFIPPDVPHQPVNLSNTEPAQAIVVRDDPNEQEHVILYTPQEGPQQE